MRDQADNLTSYRWNARGQMTGMTLATGSQAEYVYDENGHRTQQTVNGVETNYLWDEFSQYGDVVLETEPVTGDSTHYTLVNGRVLSQHENGLTSYLLDDAQNTTIALADAAGDVTGQYEYDAFGELLDTSDAPDTNYLYTGQQYDPMSELYSLRARYYNPSQGRFLSRDEWAYNFQNPLELNRYVYTANNPVNYTDPSGNNLVGMVANYWKNEPMRAVMGSMIGFVTGMAVGAITAGIQWQAIKHGLCGDRELNFGLGQFMEISAAIGGVFGGLVGLLPPSLAMVVMGAASGAGLLVAGMDIAVNGLNVCNLINLIMSFISGSTSQVTIPLLGTSISLQGNALAGQAVVVVTIPNVAAGSLAIESLWFSMTNGGDDSNGDDSNDGSNPPPNPRESLRERMLEAVIQEFKGWRDFEYTAEAWEEFVDFEGPKTVANEDPRLSIPRHQQQRYQVAVNDMFEGRVEISVNYDPINDIFGTIKRASGK